VWRRVEAEGHRVADIQVSNRDTLGLNHLRRGDDISNGVREAVDASGDGYRMGIPGEHVQSYGMPSPKLHLIKELEKTYPRITLTAPRGRRAVRAIMAEVFLGVGWQALEG
jgi:hypothetical protein